MTSRSIPANFPRSRAPASLSGMQPKLAVRYVDGVYTDAWSERELAERYAACLDMVHQLTQYTRRKLKEHPDWTLEKAISLVQDAVRKKNWGFTHLEIAWMVSKLRDALA